MNRLLLDAHEVRGGEVLLPRDDRRARHLVDVLGARTGLALRAGVVGGATGRAEVTAVDAGGVGLRVLLDGPASAAPPVDLVLALPRPKVLSRVLQGAAAAGVARIDLVNAWRVDRSYFDSPRLTEEALAEDVRLGCEQAGTTFVPAVKVHRLLMPFLADAGAWFADAAHRVVAHPRAREAIEAAVPPGVSGRVVLAVGPEGGWIDRELGSLEAVGFRVVRLGDGVLRVEGAVVAALAQLELLRRL